MVWTLWRFVWYAERRNWRAVHAAGSACVFDVGKEVETDWHLHFFRRRRCGLHTLSGLTMSCFPFFYIVDRHFCHV